MNKYKKDSRGFFRTRIYIGTDINGKKQYKQLTSMSQKELDAKVKELKNNLLKGVDVYRCDDTFGKWTERYICYMEKQVHQERKTEQEFSKAKSRINSFLSYNNFLYSKVPLKDVRTEDIESFLYDLYRYNPYTKKQSSHKTLVGYKQEIAKVFEYARRERAYIYPNPCDYVEIPEKASKKLRNSINYYTISLILQTEHKAQTAVCIMLLAGLRRGEMAALTWFDIDFNNNTININKSYSEYDHQIKAPKTQSGIRTVTMNNTLKEILLPKYKEFMSSPQKSPLIIERANGGYMTSPAWSNLMRLYLRKLHEVDTARKESSTLFTADDVLEDFTCHQLRHTYVSLNMWAGVDIKTTQELSGHSDYQVTANIYSHSNEEVKKEAARLQDEFIRQKIKIV